MEKLVDLLNQFEKERIEKINSEGKLFVKLQFKPYTEESLTNKAYRSCWLEICSKYYGFIKWLVENDKIDFSLIPNKIKEIGIPMKINGEIKYGFDSSDYYWLLMLLSISDTPIDDLISYLK